MLEALGSPGERSILSEKKGRRTGTGEEGKPASFPQEESQAGKDGEGKSERPASRPQEEPGEAEKRSGEERAASEEEKRGQRWCRFEREKPFVMSQRALLPGPLPEVSHGRSMCCRNVLAGGSKQRDTHAGFLQIQRAEAKLDRSSLEVRGKSRFLVPSSLRPECSKCILFTRPSKQKGEPLGRVA